MVTTQDIRQWATALPEVSEINHFRFAVPAFKVRGRTFVGLGKDETTAVFCISEREAEATAAQSPGSSWCVRRMDARRSFLGLEVDLEQTPRDLVRQLVEDAWRCQAPKRLIASYNVAP